jgi:hypothetical protein
VFEKTSAAGRLFRLWRRKRITRPSRRATPQIGPMTAPAIAAPETLLLFGVMGVPLALVVAFADGPLVVIVVGPLIVVVDGLLVVVGPETISEESGPFSLSTATHLEPRSEASGT